MCTDAPGVIGEGRGAGTAECHQQGELRSVCDAHAVKGVGQGVPHTCCVWDGKEPVAPPPETLFESITQGDGVSK